MTIQAVSSKTFSDKVIGLIGTKNPKNLYFETRWGIHTIGVRFPIDVVILDDTYVIRKMKQYLKPYRIFIWNPRYKKVVELPAGTIEKEKIKIGEEIDLKLA